MNWDYAYDVLLSRGTWIAFSVFILGLLVRCVFLFGISLERDRPFYNHMDWTWGIKSIIRWLIPLGTKGWRQQPLFSLAVFLFHAIFLILPFLLSAHNILLQNAWGFSLPSISDSTADLLTIVFIISAALLMWRRIARPEVRFLSTWWDYTLLILSSLPFITGFLAYHQIGPYKVIIVLHLLSAELLLILLPFSKLAHMILYFFTRSFIGFEMGARRGARCW